MIYNPGQLKEIYPYLDKTPDWFLIGGPADGNEAQCAKSRWPNVKVFACEPAREMVEWQLNNEFPSDGLLLPFALIDHCGEIPFVFNSQRPRGGTSFRDSEGESRVVPGVTLDSMSEKYGPFNNAVLWLDIEGAEYAALCGAERLFEKRSIQLVNLEFIVQDKEQCTLVEQFLSRHSFVCVGRHSDMGTHHDRIYKRT